MDNVRILHITVRADIGGGPGHIDTLVNNSSKRVVSFVAAPNQWPHWGKYKETLGFDSLIELPANCFSFSSAFRLIHFVRLKKINIIHAHGRGASVYARFCGVLLRIPVVYTPHGIHLSKKKLLNSIFYLIYEMTTSWVTDAVIFVSESEKNKANKYNLFSFCEKFVINNGIPCFSYGRDKADYKSDLCDKLNIPAGSFVCISLSRFDVAKNVGSILNIAHECGDIFFVVFGVGPDFNIIKSRIEKDRILNVILPGVTGTPLIELAGSDIYLSTSLFEGLPLSVIESMSCGLPVVASDVTGNKDCVVNGHTGFLFPVSEPKVAAEKIKLLKDSPLLMEYMSRNAVERQRVVFGVESMCIRLERLYMTLTHTQVE